MISQEGDPTHTVKEDIGGSQMALEVALEMVCDLRLIHGPAECNNETNSRKMKELHKYLPLDPLLGSCTAGQNYLVSIHYLKAVHESCREHT